jgi:flavin-dependent dehydrogenase
MAGSPRPVPTTSAWSRSRGERTVTQRLDTEICVIGGGPAGASLARRLAQLGHQVCLIERSAFPRAHVGEALTPGIWPLLDALGLREAVQEARFLPSTEARVRWEDEAVRHVRTRAGEPGLLVDRGRFDGLLLEAARAVGVRVLQPARALWPQRSSGGWEVPVLHEGRELRVSARFLADASGRASCLGGRKVVTSARTLALYGYWRCAGLEGPETRVEAGPDAWYWGAPLPDGTFNAMVFVDPRSLRERQGRTLEAYYRELLGRSALLEGCAHPSLVGRVFASDATSYADAAPIEDDFIKVGEASFAIDPLSSSGVQKAVQTALAGSIAVHTLRVRPGNAAAARRFYVDDQRYSVEQHAAWAAGYYREHQRHRDHPFWRHRALPEPARPPREERGAVDAVALHRRWKMAREAVLVDTPCIVGEVVESRRALSHPNLGRPVAYLDQVELAPLLDGLGEGLTLPQMAGAWLRHVPLQKGMAIAGWLYRNGLLTEA